MTENIYIKFARKPLMQEAKMKNSWRRKLVSIFLFFIPKANPEFDELLDDVAEWQLEIDAISNIPIREIGKDINGESIIILPWLNNYSYWSDNNVTLDYFKSHFNAANITKAEFDNNWSAFVVKPPKIK